MKMSLRNHKEPGCFSLEDPEFNLRISAFEFYDKTNFGHKEEFCFHASDGAIVFKPNFRWIWILSFVFAAFGSTRKWKWCWWFVGKNKSHSPKKQQPFIHWSRVRAIRCPNNDVVLPIVPKIWEILIYTKFVSHNTYYLLLITRVQSWSTHVSCKDAALSPKTLQYYRF